MISAYAVYDLNGGSFDLSDREVLLVVTGSMDGEPQDYEIPTIPIRSLIMIEHIGQDEIDGLKVGDVIAYQSGSMTIVHRLVGFGDGYLVLKGDANISSENVPFDDVVGKVVGTSALLGEITYAVKTNSLLSVVFVLCFVGVMYSLVAVLRILGKKEES